MNNFLKLASRNRSLIIFFALIAAVCSQRFTGFMMILVTPPALLVGLVQLGRAWRIAEKRMHCLFSIGVVVVASAVVGAAHGYQYLSAREEADHVVRQILDFREKQGRFPNDESELGGAALRDRSNSMLRPHYSLQPDGKPVLFYLATFVPYDLWQYDFSSQTWTYVPD
jgi:hypothetical protein